MKLKLEKYVIIYMYLMQFFKIEGKNNPIQIVQTREKEHNTHINIDFFSLKSNTRNENVKEMKVRTSYNYFYDKYKSETINKLVEEGIETNSKNINSRMGEKWALHKEKKDKEYKI